MPDLRRRWTGRITTVARLSWTERWILLQAVAILSVVGLSLTACGVRRVHAAMARRLAPRTATVGDAAATRVQAIARLVDIASRHAPRSHTCLPRSLALWWLLRRRDLDASFHLGTRKVGEAFEAHAWVEHAGNVVNDHDVIRSGYVPLAWRPLRDDA